MTQWSFAYEPYGLTRSATKNDPLAPDNPLRFAGEYQDSTGLYHLRARQYDPASGRFLSTDPPARSRAVPAVSSYVYADDRPTAFVDPLGLGPVVPSGPQGPASFLADPSYPDCRSLISIQCVEGWLYGDDAPPDCDAWLSFSCVDAWLRDDPALKFVTFLSITGAGATCIEGIAIGTIGGPMGAAAGCVAGVLAFAVAEQMVLHGFLEAG